MRYIPIIFIFLFFANIVSAGDISRFVFTTNSQTIKPNEISEKITIQSQDAAGNSVEIPQTACIELKTTSVTGEFSSSNTNWSPVTRLTMNKNTANRNFYYKDSINGSYKLTARVSLRPEGEDPCASWPIEEWNVQWTAEQGITVSESGGGSTPPLASPEPASSTGSSAFVEPQIFANAGLDKTAIAGADVKFSGQAFGLQKEPLEGARYLWSFGDGSTKEGQSVLHSYQYPGDYIAVLEVSSGKFSASDRTLVKALPNELKITEANNDYIKLHNGSGVDLDISFWFLKSESQSFKFPENTFIKSNSDLTIPSSVSKIVLISQGQKAELLYPNSSVACQFIQQETVPQASAQETIKHSVSNSNDSNEEQSTENVESAQVAQVVQAGQVVDAINIGENESSWSIKEWLMLIGGIIVISAFGLFFVRRQSPV